MTWISKHNAWLPIFLVAFIYYTFLSQSNTTLLSYLNLLPSYEPIPTRIEWMPENPLNMLDKIFGNVKKNKNVFETVIQDKNASFYDVIWVEDANLGRGYLLISDSAHAGKVWRYETGGGLFPIGKSLYLEKSGCRSKSDQECGGFMQDHPPYESFNYKKEMGSRGICVQVMKDADRFDIGSLVLVEGGERRIVRMEEDGGRTPLLIQRDVDHIVYTPFGDLLFTERLERSIIIPNKEDENEVSPPENLLHVNGTITKDIQSVLVKETNIYRLREIVNYPSIPFSQSREAHSWKETDLLQHWSKSNHRSVIESSDRLPVLMYTGMSSITSMVVGMDLTTLYIAGSMKIQDQERNVIVKVPMMDDDEKDEENVDQSLSNQGTFVIGSQHILLDLEKVDVQATTATLTLDQFGNVYIGHMEGLTIIDPTGNVKASVHVEGLTHPTGLVIGNDGYLYMTTRNSLLRYKMKAKANNFPTNLIVPTIKKK